MYLEVIVLKKVLTKWILEHTVSFWKNAQYCSNDFLDFSHSMYEVIAVENLMCRGVKDLMPQKRLKIGVGNSEKNW